jgi:hypothetical protein
MFLSFLSLFFPFQKSCEKKKKGKERPKEIAILSAESIDMPFILLPFSHRSENLELAHLHFLSFGGQLTLSFPLMAKYNLSDFNVLFLKILQRSPMIDFCTTIS